MKLTKSIGMAFVSVLGISAPAMADVTPAELWHGLQESAQKNGMTITADESESGNALVIKNIVFSQSFKDDTGSQKMSLTEMTLEQMDDGSIAVKCPADLKMLTEVTMKDGEITKANVDIDCTQIDFRFKGTLDDYTTHYSGPSMGMKFVPVVAPGETDDPSNLVLTLTGLSGQSAYSSGEGIKVKQSLTAEGMSYSVFAYNPKNMKEVTLDSKYEGFALEGEFSADSQDFFTDPQQALGQFEMAVNFSVDKSETEFVAKEGDVREAAGHTGLGKSQGSMSVTDGVIGLKSEGTDFLFNLSAGAPMPVEFTIPEAAFHLTIPTQPNEDPQNFSIGMKLREAKLPDVLWAMFDPQSNFPHDPLTLALDLDGTTLVSTFTGGTGTANTTDGSEQTPPKLESLKISELFLGAVGAELTGSGDLKFSYASDAPDVPIPDGKVELSLSGSSALIDKLIASGLVSQEQATSARMMLGLFTRPGAGEDMLNSTFEFTSDGQILANGQRIK